MRWTASPCGRSPHGERGLKYGDGERVALYERRRSPHGERGLKYGRVVTVLVLTRVALLMESVD